MRRFIEHHGQGKKVAAKIIARAWRDPAYREQLIADPRSTFAASGVHVPEDIPITVAVDSDAQLNVLLAAGPATGKLKPLPAAPDVRSVWAYIDARSRADAAFREQLLADPTGTVRGLGLDLAPGTTVVAHVERPDHAIFILPRPPRGRVEPGEDKPDDGDIVAYLYFAIPLVADDPADEA